MSELKNRYESILKKIDRAASVSGRSFKEIVLLAVSKGVEAQRMAELVALGHRDFGENYVQEFLTKKEALDSDLRWHFIGHLQSNKAKAIASEITCLHSLASEKLALELEKRLAPTGRKLPVFLELNLDREPSKDGFLEESLTQAQTQIREKCPHLQIEGLMVIPSGETSTDPQKARAAFAKTREIAKKLGLSGLSMGMSGDFEIAIEEGATHVRVGTALFGPRPPKL